jgi:tight adherence protein C
MNLLLAVVVLCVASAAGLLFWGLRGFIEEVPRQDRRFQDPLPLGIRLIWPLVGLATGILGPHLKPRQLEPAHRRLQAAGQDFVLTPEQLYGLRAVAVLIGALFPYLALLLLGTHGFKLYFSGMLLGGLAGYFYPDLWLSERRKKRQRMVLRDLPVFLDFIVMTVEAGMNITGGVEQATQKGPPGPLNQEFSRLLRDLRSGLPRAEALQRMAERMDMSQISSFTGSLIQSDRVGASLGETLRAQASQRREERFLRAEKLALEAPVKMMAPLVMFFFPLMFVVLGYFIYLRMKQEGIL